MHLEAANARRFCRSLLSHTCRTVLHGTSMGPSTAVEGIVQAPPSSKTGGNPGDNRLRSRRRGPTLPCQSCRLGVRACTLPPRRQRNNLNHWCVEVTEAASPQLTAMAAPFGFEGSMFHFPSRIRSCLRKQCASSSAVYDP